MDKFRTRVRLTRFIADLKDYGAAWTSMTRDCHSLLVLPAVTRRKNVSLVQKSRRTSMERSFFAECPYCCLSVTVSLFVCAFAFFDHLLRLASAQSSISNGQQKVDIVVLNVLHVFT
jgi:hypothetical protein